MSDENSEDADEVTVIFGKQEPSTTTIVHDYRPDPVEVERKVREAREKTWLLQLAKEKAGGDVQRVERSQSGGLSIVWKHGDGPTSQQLVGKDEVETYLRKKHFEKQEPLYEAK